MAEETAGLTDAQRQWLEHVTEAQRSGLTLRAYAERHALSVAQLYSWRGSLKKRGLLPGAEPGARLTPVRIVGAVAGPVIRVHLPGGVLVEAEGQADPHTLLALLRALR